MYYRNVAAIHRCSLLWDQNLTRTLASIPNSKTGSQSIKPYLWAEHWGYVHLSMLHTYFTAADNGWVKLIYLATVPKLKNSQSWSTQAFRSMTCFEGLHRLSYSQSVRNTRLPKGKKGKQRQWNRNWKKKAHCDKLLEGCRCIIL